MRGQRLLPAVALAVLVAGCGGGFERQAGSSATSSAPAAASGSASPSASSGPGSSSGPSSSSEPHDGDGEHVPPFPADIRPDTGQASAGARGTITDIRIGHHDGFDRVVFEFHGTGTPGWTVKYVPLASAQGSGNPIHLEGRAILSVALTGVGYPTDTGIAEFPRGLVTGPDTDVVVQAFFNGTFEGVSQAFVATTAQRPFRVYLLTDPARVVLEVRDH
jgi:hypothetical protein